MHTTRNHTRTSSQICTIMNHGLSEMRKPISALTLFNVNYLYSCVIEELNERIMNRIQLLELTKENHTITVESL